MQSFLSYKRLLEREHALGFFYVLIVDIVEDWRASVFFSTNSRETSIRYVALGKMMLKHQSVLLYFVKLAGKLQR